MMKLTRGKHLLSPIGLDLGASVVKAAQVRGGAPGALPALTGAMTLERAQPGQPFDENEALRLREVLHRRGLWGRQVVVSVPVRSTMASVLTLPPRKEGVPLDQIVRAELAHEHRVDAESFELAWWELPRPARAAAGTHAMAVACGHHVADEVLSVLRRAGFDVLGLDVEGWAIARACSPLIPSPADIVASVDLGWDSTTLVLLHQGVVVYERSTFGAGLRQLRKVLEEDQQYPPPVVDYLLHDMGFELAARGRTDDAAMLGKSLTAMQTHFDHVVKELSLSLDYAQSQYPSATIAQVLLIGGGAMVPGAAEYVGRQLEAPVSVPRASQVTRGAEAFGELAARPALMQAIGLARYDEVAGHDAQEAA